MGGCAVVWFVTTFLGAALIWPRLWTAFKSWRPIFAVRARQGGYKFNYDLHRSASVITLPVLIVVAFTSIYLNLPNMVRPLVQQFSPVTNFMSTPGVGRVAFDQAIQPPEQAVATALAILPDARVNTVFRDFAKGLYWVRLQLPTDVSPSGDNFVYVNMLNGAPTLTRLAANRSGADTFLAWQLPLHDGTAFGLAGQIIICLTSLVIVVMCVTGLNVWLRKRRSARKVRAANFCSAAGRVDLGV